MRIGIDVTIVGKRGGIPTYALRLVRALLRLSGPHSFFLWSRSGNATRIMNQSMNGRPLELVTGGPVRWLLGDFGEYGWGSFLSLARRGEPLDVVHGLNYGVTSAAAGAARVVTVHDLSVLRFPEWHTRRRVLLLGGALRRTIERVEAIITDCEAVRLELIGDLRVDPEHVIAVPHAAGAEFRVLPSDQIEERLRQHRLSTAGYILYAGAIEPRKNLLRLLEAHSILRSRGDAPPLVLVGPAGWRNAEIHERIERSGSSVRYLGYVRDAELPVLMSGAAAFIYPSLYEGFGLPALEALACGTPTLLSDTAALHEIADGAAVFVDPSSAEAIAHGIQHILGDEALRERLRKVGPLRASAYSWERTARETVSVYEIARQRGSRRGSR